MCSHKSQTHIPICRLPSVKAHSCKPATHSATSDDRRTPVIQDDIDLFDYNVNERVNDFVAAAFSQPPPHTGYAPHTTVPPRMSSTADKEEIDTPRRRRLSCTKYFDALWFCYSPVHQLQQYYRLGALDNCSGKWSALYDCLSLKTKRVSEAEEILEDREKSKQHIWTFRSHEEARSHWEKIFGHLDGQE